MHHQFVTSFYGHRQIVDAFAPEEFRGSYKCHGFTNWPLWGLTEVKIRTQDLLRLSRQRSTGVLTLGKDKRLLNGESMALIRPSEFLRGECVHDPTVSVK